MVIFELKRLSRRRCLALKNPYLHRQQAFHAAIQAANEVAMLTPSSPSDTDADLRSGMVRDVDSRRINRFPGLIVLSVRVGESGDPDEIRTDVDHK
jgi:hypothetical protein